MLRNIAPGSLLTIAATALLLLPVTAVSQQTNGGGQTAAKVRVMVHTPGQANNEYQRIDYQGEPRLYQVTQRLRWQRLYWPTARLCTAQLQNKLLARKAAAVRQLQLLKSWWHNDEQPQLAQQADKLLAQLKQWPLLATMGRAGEQGLEPYLLEAQLQQNWLLKAGQQPYTLFVGQPPQQVHWLGVTDSAGSYAFADQPLVEWVSRRQPQLLSHAERIWEISLDGSMRQLGLQQHNQQQEYLQPGAILFSGFAEQDLPAGFRDTNQQLLRLLRYWQPGKNLADEVSQCG